MVEFAERRPRPGAAPEPAADVPAVREARRRVPVPTELVVGEPGDRYEREADQVAADVARLMSGVPGTGGAGRAQAASHSAAPERPTAVAASRVQRMSNGDSTGHLLDDDTDRQVRTAMGHGRPLPAAVRRQAESAFGADFGGVRVHDDARATELNHRIQAKAFTTGQDIFFRDGLPDPASAAGGRLLAHELTHTVQQAGSARPTVQRYLDASKAQELETARQQLKALLQTTKPKKKAAVEKRKAKIADLRSTIEGLESIDAATPEPTDEPDASIALTATDPARQEELDRKVARLHELEAQDPSGLDAKQAKNREQSIARLNRGIATLTAPAAEEVVAAPTPVPEDARATQKPGATAPSPTGSTGQPTKDEPKPEPVAPDLAVESLRTTAAELAELKGKELPPAGNARKRHNKKIKDLETKVAALEAAIQAAHPDLSALVGNAHAQELANEFGGGLAALRLAVPDVALKTMCDKVGAASMKLFVDLYGPKTFWARMSSWGPAAVEGLLATFTPAQIRALDTSIGAARFVHLLNVRRLPPAAFEQYPATFLKTFAGATDRTWEHLVTIKYSTHDGETKISGGHDLDVFYDFVDAENDGLDEDRITIDSTRAIGPYEKVVYSIWEDGEVIQTGSKTLIPGLTGMKATMLADVNAALWHAIASCTFDTGSNQWSAATPDGTASFSGFFRNGRIDTFFPD